MSLSNMFSAVRDKIAEIVWPRQRYPRLVLIESECPDPKDPNAEPGFMCRAGEDIVCDGPEQHTIATAAEDIATGAMSTNANEQFYWFQAPPALGTPMLDIKCQHCDGRWVASAMHLHFKGGWR